jgi:hypothetical protein
MISEPEKELRFTRSGQAVQFCILGAVSFSIAVTLLASAWYRDINPELPHPAWALVFVALGIGAFWLARHLTRYAYLILTPLGVEVFPFFKPSKDMQLVTWQEIAEAEVSEDGKLLSLHFNRERTAGMHLSLRPVRRNLRSLLAKAVLGRVCQRQA